METRIRSGKCIFRFLLPFCAIDACFLYLQKEFLIADFDPVRSVATSETTFFRVRIESNRIAKFSIRTLANVQRTFNDLFELIFRSIPFFDPCHFSSTSARSTTSLKEGSSIDTFLEHFRQRLSRSTTSCKRATQNNINGLLLSASLYFSSEARQRFGLRKKFAVDIWVCKRRICTMHILQT